ncbi:MAG: hypothetical protein LBH18_05275 [Spirochaetaceae bacterium]|nr:hypothetical protein [Spirochaetaceae bacterium]
MVFQMIAVAAIGTAALAALILYIIRIFRRKGCACCDEGGSSAKCPHCKK